MRNFFGIIFSASLLFSVLFLSSCKNSDDFEQILVSIQYEYDTTSDSDYYLVTKYIAVKNDDDAYTIRLYATYHFEKKYYSKTTNETFRKIIDSSPTIWLRNERYKTGGFGDYSITKTGGVTKCMLAQGSVRSLCKRRRRRTPSSASGDSLRSSRFS